MVEGRYPEGIKYFSLFLKVSLRFSVAHFQDCVLGVRKITRPNIFSNRGDVFSLLALVKSPASQCGTRDQILAEY